MINRIIDEINVCMNNNCFLAALSTALTLPDICGRAEYGNIANGKRYVDWVNNFVSRSKVLGVVDEYSNIDGEWVYNLRNNTLHQGTFNIGGNVCEIDDFEILVQNTQSASLVDYSCSRINEAGNNVDRYFCVNAITLINKICVAAKNHYNNNKEKYNFIKNKVVAVSKAQYHIYTSVDGMTYENCLPLNKSQVKSKWSDFYE